MSDEIRGEKSQTAMFNVRAECRECGALFKGMTYPAGSPAYLVAHHQADGTHVMSDNIRLSAPT